MSPLVRPGYHLMQLHRTVRPSCHLNLDPLNSVSHFGFPKSTPGLAGLPPDWVLLLENRHPSTGQVPVRLDTKIPLLYLFFANASTRVLLCLNDCATTALMHGRPCPLHQVPTYPHPTPSRSPPPKTVNDRMIGKDLRWPWNLQD